MIMLFPSPQLLPCSPSTIPFISLPPHWWPLITQTDSLFFILLLHILLHIQLHINIQTAESISIAFLYESRAHHVDWMIYHSKGWSLRETSPSLSSHYLPSPRNDNEAYPRETSRIQLTQQDLNNGNTKIKI